MNQTAKHILYAYALIAFLFLLYEQPWNKKAWTDSDGVINTNLAWTYTIFWPYAIYKEYLG